MSTISLRLPDSLHKKARALAKKENTSINQLVSTALAEKISALLTEDYIEQRSKRASKAKYKKVLSKIPDVESEDYDK